MFGRILQGELRMSNNRGRILCEGRINQWTDTVSGQWKMFFKFVSLIVILILMLIGIFSGVLVLTINLNGYLNYLDVIPIVGSIFLLLYFLIYAIGFETDAIYENGITSICTNLIDKIKHESFIEYVRIKLVGYGTIGSHKFFEGKEFLAVFSDNIVLTYINRYVNDFFDEMINILRKKCPHVPWVKMEWLEWKKEDFSIDELIRKNSSLCPYCGQPLTYIHQYNRWYCYNCQEYAPEE